MLDKKTSEYFMPVKSLTLCKHFCHAKSGTRPAGTCLIPVPREGLPLSCPVLTGTVVKVSTQHEGLQAKQHQCVSWYQHSFCLTKGNTDLHAPQKSTGEPEGQM